jgi:preprotein translocase subunit SecD
MKSIFYIIIASLIYLSIASFSLNTSKTITLQAAQIKSSKEILTQSGNIIMSRLKTYGVESSFVIIPEKSQIEVQMPSNTNITEIESLLTTEGKVAFYETLTLKEIAEGSVIREPDNSSDAKLCCLTFADDNYADSLDNVLKSLNLPVQYTLAWGLKNSNSMICLYALKLNEKGISPLSGSDIETAKASLDKNSQSFIIDIKFKSASSDLWAVTTTNSIGKPIAIVIDDKVFYTPVVRDRVENGLCEISGSFSRKDVNFFLAIVNNDQLPGRFMIK